MKEIKVKNTKSVFYELSLLRRAEVNLVSYINSLYNVSCYLITHSKPVKVIIAGGKGQNTKSVIFMPPVLPMGEAGVTLTSFLDSLYVVSDYLAIHSKAEKVVIHEKMGKS